MPELPEVETTCRGLAPTVVAQQITRAVVRHRGMRQPIPRGLEQRLQGKRVDALSRRGKYLLFQIGTGTLIIHLGMSGRLWLVNAQIPPQKHDHFDLEFSLGPIVRLRDPRRFGLVLWHGGDINTHPLIARIGPEPLTDDFNAAVLYAATRQRSAAIKLVIMDSHVVAGVGNIYANEALYRAHIDPRLAAHRLSLKRCESLVIAIKETLALAISAGGSSLRDYVGSDGQAGVFQNQFLVYDRLDHICSRCGANIREIRQGQRATYFCPGCQRR